MSSTNVIDQMIIPAEPKKRFFSNPLFLYGLMPLVAAYLIFFIIPIFEILHQSVLDEGYTLQNFIKILKTPIYFRALANTFFISFLVTLGSIVLSYPLAYLMATVRPTFAKILMLVVLLPFWTSALVRTTAWIVILQKNGILNSVLVKANILNEPMAFVFNLSGVLIGMIHVLMPFLVFPLYAAFRSLDRNLLLAAESLGAGPVKIFLRIIAPMTAPGVTAGSIIVFMHSLGYFITPSLLGGPKQTMIAQMVSYHINEKLDWGMAAALAIVLLCLTLGVFFLFQHFLGLDRLWGGFESGGSGDTIGAVPRPVSQWSFGGIGVGISGILVAIFLIAPIIAVFPMSMSSSPFLVFPPPSYSLKWFVKFFTTRKWILSLQNSIEVAIIAVSLATFLGTAAALALSRLRFRFKDAVQAYIMLPMVVPVIVLALGLYYFYAPMGLVGSKLGLAIGHAILGMPVVFITVSASLKTFDRNQELAAYSFGAGKMTMFRLIMLPHIWPGMAAGALFAFIVSFDDVILALFLTNIRSRTLPKLMYEGVAHEIDPTITAIAVLLICFSILVLSINIIFSKVKESR